MSETDKLTDGRLALAKGNIRTALRDIEVIGQDLWRGQSREEKDFEYTAALVCKDAAALLREALEALE